MFTVIILMATLKGGYYYTSRRALPGYFPGNFTGRVEGASLYAGLYIVTSQVTGSRVMVQRKLYELLWDGPEICCLNVGHT